MNASVVAAVVVGGGDGDGGDGVGTGHHAVHAEVAAGFASVVVVDDAAAAASDGEKRMLKMEASSLDLRCHHLPICSPVFRDR